MESLNRITKNEEKDLDTICYKRKVFYYETDQMGVVHHSNYIRWFEESRVYFLEQIGFGYDRMEALGILSPVLAVNCEYKNSVKFNDTVLIYPSIESFNGIKMTIRYKVVDEISNQVMATGETKHCFVSPDFKPVRMKKDFKEVYDVIAGCLPLD